MSYCAQLVIRAQEVELPSADQWSSTIVPLIIAILGASVAVLWPWLQARQRAGRFQRIIARELEELGPNTSLPAGLPWWRYLTKRFVHEEVFAQPNISTNREFLLTLDPDVLYGVSQLWMAYNKRDGDPWNYFLAYLSKNPILRSEELDQAVALWNHLISEAAHTVRLNEGDPVVDWGAGLFEARIHRYGSLLALTQPLSTGPRRSSVAVRNKRADDLTKWYYTDSGDLLLSGDSMLAWFRLQERLVDPTTTNEVIETMFRDLRTCLKIDLGVPNAEERYVQFDMSAQVRSASECSKSGSTPQGRWPFRRLPKS
jgi:hypothetical protein